MRRPIVPPRILISLLLIITSCSDGPLTLQEPFLQCPEEIVTHYGEATYYRFADGRGSCSFDSSSADVMIGAMNGYDFAGSQICGASVRITGPDSTITVRIVDLCPECPRGDIDLSTKAFSLIADTLRGRVAISWHFLPASVSGPIAYRFKDSINQWWTAVQIRNHRYPIYSVEYCNAQNTYRHLERTGYNYFAGYANMGSEPFIFRVTDIYGQKLIDSGIVPIYNKDIPGKGQFPLCSIHKTMDIK